MVEITYVDALTQVLSFVNGATTTRPSAEAIAKTEKAIESFKKKSAGNGVNKKALENAPIKENIVKALETIGSGSATDIMTSVNATCGKTYSLPHITALLTQMAKVDGTVTRTMDKKKAIFSLTVE